MENASKALIIAGAILVSILIISLGIIILNQAQSAMEGSGMSDVEITAFNQKFTKYDGNQKGSMVRSLVQEVLANNSSDSSPAKVSVTGKVTLGESDTKPTYGDGFSNTKTYKVEITEYQKGRVKTITVSE